MKQTGHTQRPKKQRPPMPCIEGRVPKPDERGTNVGLYWVSNIYRTSMDMAIGNCTSTCRETRTLRLNRKDVIFDHDPAQLAQLGLPKQRILDCAGTDHCLKTTDLTPADDE